MSAAVLEVVIESSSAILSLWIAYGGREEAKKVKTEMQQRETRGETRAWEATTVSQPVTASP